MEASDKDFDDLVAAVRREPSSRLLARLLRDAVVSVDRSARVAVLTASLPAGTEALAELHDFARHPATDGNVVSFGDHRAAAAVSEPRDGFGSVGGLDHVKEQLRRRLLDPLRHKTLFARFGRRTGGGLLLYGPPGCGKTMVIRAAAAEAKANLVIVEVADILDSRVGWSEKRIVAAFDEARERRPSILFFDEVEALASRRGHASEHQASLVSAFLNVFDGMDERNAAVLVVAATNAPWSVDSAFRRPGRFDRTLFVPPPDRDARRAILGSLLVSLPLAGAVDVDLLVERTAWFSGADLRALVETAIDQAIDETIRTNVEAPVRPEHLVIACAEVKPTTREWLATARNYAKYANNGGIYDDVLTFLDHIAR